MTFSATQIAHLRKEFERADVQRDGRVTPAELARFLNEVFDTDVVSPDSLAAVFARLDADGSGALAFEEFLALYSPADIPAGVIVPGVNDRDDKAAGEA